MTKLTILCGGYTLGDIETEYVNLFGTLRSFFLICALIQICVYHYHLKQLD